MLAQTDGDCERARLAGLAVSTVDCRVFRGAACGARRMSHGRAGKMVVAWVGGRGRSRVGRVVVAVVVVVGVWSVLRCLARQGRIGWIGDRGNGLGLGGQRWEWKVRRRWMS